MKLNQLQEKIAELIVQEFIDVEIAEELGYSLQYVKKNVTILKKYFKVKNRVGIAREWLLQRLSQ